MADNEKTLEDLLVCPKSHSKLILDGEGLVCSDPECRLRFEIRDEIPVMLFDEASELSEEEWKRAIRQHSE